MGALDVDNVVNKHQGWRLITCMWLHGGVFHLLANMFGILLIGIRLEQDFGFGMYHILSILCPSSVCICVNECLIRIEKNFEFYFFSFCSIKYSFLISLIITVLIGLLYLISGFGGSLLSALFIQRSLISVGASSALFGLLGGMLSELITNWSIYEKRVLIKFLIYLTCK
jgi:membrane associated rhomboid family serine protease